jgi:hypothetical protein
MRQLVIQRQRQIDELMHAAGFGGGSQQQVRDDTLLAQSVAVAFVETDAEQPRPR